MDVLHDTSIAKKHFTASLVIAMQADAGSVSLLVAIASRATPAAHLGCLTVRAFVGGVGMGLANSMAHSADVAPS